MIVTIIIFKKKLHNDNNNLIYPDLRPVSQSIVIDWYQSVTCEKYIKVDEK